MRELFYNAKVYVEQGNFQEALLIEGNTIVEVGSNEALLKQSYDKKTDCGGRTIIPGFNDSHLHMSMTAANSLLVKLSDCNSIDAVIERTKEYMRKYPERKVISGMGWLASNFTEGEQRNLNRHDLDKISTEIPIILLRGCYHTLVCNTKAIELAGVTKDSVFEGGSFGVEDGYPNGIFAEHAKEPIAALIPELSDDEYIEAMKNTAKYAVSKGVTTVQSNDLGLQFPLERGVSIYKRLYASGEYPLRTRHQICYDSPQEMIDFITKYRKDKDFNNPFNSLGPIKMFKDGSLGGKTAQMKQPYLGEPHNCGVEVLPPEEADAMCKAAYEHDMQIVTHAIGNMAIQKMIESFSPYIKENKNKYRWGIIHFQIADDEIFDLAEENNVVYMPQPIFLDADIVALPDRIPEELQRTSYAFKTMNERGTLCISTDSPIEDLNPFDNIYCAVSRKRLNGEPEGGFIPEEALTMEEAIDAYTLNNAFAEFAEDYKGRLKAGYLADFVILDKDIFTCREDEIRSISPVRTVIDGKTVFEDSSV